MTTYTVRHFPGPGSDWQTCPATSLRRAKAWARSSVAEGHPNDSRAYIVRTDGTDGIEAREIAQYENVNGRAVLTFAA